MLLLLYFCLGLVVDYDMTPAFEIETVRVTAV